jgi:hypothetical protein
MDTAFRVYVGLWAAFCAGAALVAVTGPRPVLATRAYARFLLRPWKIATFAVAFAGIVVVAPFTGDPYWDHVDAAFMALLAFTTAPWSMGVLFQATRGRRRVREALPAVATWLFSASWSYDLWLLVRDGAYPVTWAHNLVASSCLYAFAGLFWSLDWRPGRGVVFAFMDADWPRGEPARFGRLLVWALPVMAFIALLMTSSVLGWV